MASDFLKNKVKEREESGYKIGTPVVFPSKTSAEKTASKKPETKEEEPNIFQRALDIITGAAKSSGSQAAELGGLALTGLADLNRKKSFTAQTYYREKESADRYLDLMKNAKTEEEKQKWESLASLHAKKADYFKKEMDEAPEFKSVSSGAKTVYETADDLRKSAEEDLGQAKQGLGTGGQLAVDFVSTAAQWAGDAALGAVTGTGMLPMMLRSAGSGAQQARQEGATAGQQALYALGSGVVSGATERIANIASPLKKVFGKGVLDDAIKKATGKMSESAAGRVALSFLSEGGEEVVESVAQPILQNLTYDAGAKYDADWLGDTLYQGLMGGLLGGVLGGVGEVGTAASERNEKRTTGAQMNAMGEDMVQAIIDSGLEMDPESRSYQLAKKAEKKVKSGKKLTDLELGELFTETDQEYQRQTQRAAEPSAREDAGQEDIVLPTAEEIDGTDEGQGIVLPAGRSTSAGGAQTAAEQESEGGIVLPDMGNTAPNAQTSRTSAVQKTLEETAQRYGVDTNTTARVRRISDAIQRNIEFYQDEDAAQNGYYDRATDTIYINARSRNPVSQIIGHELTHSIEQTREYAQLQDVVFQELRRRGNDLDQLRENKKALYARHGVELADQSTIDSEIVAEFIEKNLLTDEESIRSLVRTNRTLAQKIREQIDKLLAKLGNKNAQEKAFLNRAKQIYTEALNETTSQTQTETGEEEQVRLTRKQRREQEEKRQKEKRNERIQEKVRATDMDKEELAAAYASGEITEEEFDKAMEDIFSDEGEIGEEMLGNPAKYSINENYAQEIEDWDKSGRPDGEVFILGETGDVLQGLGAMEQSVYLRSEKINAILETHPEMTMEEIKRIPEILDDPVLVLKSRNVGRRGKENSRMVIFGSVTAQDGRPVLTALDLMPTENRLRIENMQKVTSAYTKDNNPEMFFENSDVMYADEKRTTAILRRAGFQAPAGLLRSGSMGSISYGKNTVKMEGVPFSQVVETQKSAGKKYSFGGENARRADLNELERAKEMERQGVAAETIFQETGWYTGADGKWRFEIDDSGAQYNPRNQEGDVPGETLADYLQHDELFQNYPQLRKTRLRFENLGRGIQGSYTRSTDTITLDNSLRDAPEDVLVHEIQHAIQQAEGFAQGANEQFWSRQIEGGYDARTGAQRRNAQRLWGEFNSIRDQDPEFFQDMMDLAAIEPTVPRGQVDWETLEQIEEDPPEWQRYDQMRESLEEKYGDLRVWDFNDLRYKLKQAELNQGRSAADLYYQTAGEVEARDVTARRTLTAQERRTQMPNTGNEDTVFVEDAMEGPSYSSVDTEQTAGYDDGRTDDQQGGLNDGQNEYDSQGVSGEDVQRGIERSDPGRDGKSQAGNGTDRTGNGSPQGPSEWARKNLIDRPAPAAGEAAENAARYCADVFVVKDSAIKGRNPRAWALTSGGKIYISDDLPSDLASIVGFHESVHAAKQNKNQRYIDFVDDVGSYINFQSDGMNTLGIVVQARFPGKDLMELSPSERETVYDELNALVWGFHKADPENARAQFSDMFRDYDAYIADLDAAMESGAESWRDPGMLPTAEEYDGGGKTDGYDSDWRSLSADQQSYFKDSVARDESGRLMVLYHGSASPLFTQFNTDNGVWLTPEESYARNYADVYDSPYSDTAALTGMEREIYMPLQRQRMYEVYADLRNVADLGEINGTMDEAKLQEISRASGVDLNTLRTIAEPFMGGEAYEMTRSRAFIDAMRNAGFDGMYAEEDGVPTFCAIGGPEQVKLTSNKNPSGSTDIRYSVNDQEENVDAAAQGQEPEAEAEETAAAEEGQETDIVPTLPKKAQSYLQSAERRMVNAIGNALNVPYRAKRDFLQEAARKISNEYLKEGKITQETMDSTFEQAYEAGRVVDDEFYNQYKDIKEYLRTVPVTISQEDASDIADYNDFRKSAFGRLRITNEGGTPVDVIYEELQTMAPELFPARLTHPADQLVRMFDVAKSIQRSEKNLDEYYGDNAQEFKRWAKNEFETAVSNGLSSLRDVKRYAEDRARKSSFEPSNLTQDEVMKLYEDLKKKRKDLEKAQAKNLLTSEDEKHVNELLKGMITPEALNPESSNVKGILQMFKAKEAYEEVARKLRAWNAERRGKLNDQADQILETANSWKDKRAGILYSRETMERNIRDIVPDKELADKIVQIYFTPVHKAAADANRLKNQMREKIKAMGLSQKVTGDNHDSEAAAVQILGEAEDNIRVLENSRSRNATRDGKTLEEWKTTIDNLWHNNPDLDQQKIRDSVEQFRKIYDELFQKMNDARVRNGYEPINYRKGYFPHFQPGNTDGILDAFGRALGIKTEVTALPTTINGLTHTFKPGIRYMGNALERLGFNTAYDAVEGFDRYIEGAADVIYQTDNIQRLRALARQIRYRTGDDGIRKQVDEVLADERLTEAEKTDKIDKIYENGRFTLSNFVVELDEYTNLLANKKSRYDRSMETQAGRRAYNLAKWIESRVAANMVAVNPASWLTNFIPLTQGGAMVGNRELLTAMWDTLKSYKENDGFVDRSTFLTNRRGSDPLVRAWSEQMSAIASQPMTWIDSFVADTLVRARYSQNLKNGLSEQAAMDEADQWVAGVMADRSKGATPTLFQRSNFLTKLFTQFQLEVNNQLSYVAKDMPREYKDKGMKVLAAALLKFALGAFLFDELYEFFIGRRPALDPIGILNDTAGDLTGYELPNLVSLAGGLLTGDAPDFKTERANGYETVANLAGNVLESTPFVGSLLGGGRLPVANALPGTDVAKVFNGELPWNKRLSTAAKELGNPLTYLALPFGGGQLKKVFQTVKAVAQGGQYSIDSSGNKILQYPVYNDSITDAVGNLLTGSLFGLTSTKGGKDWVESNFKSLNAAQTETYLAMNDLGIDQETAFELITKVRDAGKTGEGTEAQLKRKALYDSDAPGIAKAAVFYGMLASDSDRETMDILDDMGADMGAVSFALMKMKDAELLKGAAASNGKRDALAAAVLTDDEKAEIYRQKISDSRDEDISAFENAGIPFNTFLEAQNEYTTINEKYDGASRKALEFSRWVNQQDFTPEQADVVKNAFAYYSMVPQSGGYYDKLVSAGMDDEAAYQISTAMEDLEPEDGEDTVSQMQRYKTITESGISEDEQMEALSSIMPESEFAKLQAGYAEGVTPGSYLQFKELLPDFDADGNGSFKQEEVTAAIEAIPGLTNAQRAALWQMQNKSWKPTRNPFNTSVSQRVYNDLHSGTAELPTEMDAGGGIVLPMG